MIFFYKEGKWFRENPQLSTALSQLLTTSMKFAFALLPIAAALGFVQAGFINVDEGFVRASILTNNIYRAHY